MDLTPYNILHTDPADIDYHEQDVRTARRQRNLRLREIERVREAALIREAAEEHRQKLEAEKQNENKTTTGN